MMLYKKALMVPSFKTSLVSSIDYFESEERNKNITENTTDLKIESPKKHEIFFEDPIIIALQTIRHSRSRLRKSRSTLSILRLKSSYIKFCYLKTSYLRCCVSKSPDSRHFESRSLSLTTSTSYSKSIKTASTYTLDGQKSSYISLQRNKSPDSPSVCSSLASFGSTSPRSGSSISRSSYSTPKRLSCTLLSNKPKKSLLKLPPYKHSCLQSFDSKSHHLRQPLIKPCIKAPAITRPQSKAPVKPSCLKSQTNSPPLNSSCSPTLLNKSCIRSRNSRSPYKRAGILTERLLHTRQISNQSSCFKSPVLKLLNKKPSDSKSKCGNLYTFLKSSQPANSNFISSSPKHSKSPKSKSPYSRLISFKSTFTKSSRSPLQIKNLQSKSVYSKPSNKTADLKSFQSSTPKNNEPRYTLKTQVDPSLKPFPIPAQQLTSTFGPINKKPSREQFPSKYLPLLLPNPKLWNLNRLPRLTVSKIHVNYLKGPQCMKGSLIDRKRNSSKPPVKSSKYKDSRSKLTRRPKKDVNREYFEQLLTTKMNVHYMLELKNYFDKIKSSFTCGGPECTALQERRHKHRAEHHPGSTANSRGHNEGYSKGSRTQPNFTLPKQGGITISVRTVPKATNTTSIDGIDTDDYEKHTEKAKTDIEIAIREWAEKVPINDRLEDHYKKEEAIRRLINNIIARDLTNRNRHEDEILKDEIRRAIANINLWYPGSKKDRMALKEALIETLFYRLMRLKNKLLEDIKAIENNKTLKSDKTDASNRQQGTSNSSYSVNSLRDYVMGNNDPSNASYSLKPGQSVTIQLGDNVEDKNIDGRTGTMKKDSFTEDRNPSNTSSSLKPGQSVHVGSKSSNIEDYNIDGRTGTIKKDNLMDNKNPSNVSYSKSPSNASYSSKNGQSNTRQGSNNNNPTMHERTNSYNRYKVPSVTQIQIRQDRPKTSIKIDDNPSHESAAHFPVASQPKRPTLRSGINYPYTNQPDNVRIYNSNYDSNTIECNIKSKGTNVPSFRDNDEIKLNKGLDDRYLQQNDSIISKSGNESAFDLCKDIRCPHQQRIPYKPNYIKIPNFEDNKGTLRNTTYDLSYGYGYEGSFKNGCAAMNRSHPKRGKYNSRKYSNESSTHDINRSKSCIYKPQSRCTIKSEDICSCRTENKTMKNHVICGIKEVDVENEVADWLQKCSFLKFSSLISKQEVINAIITNISPYLNRPHSTLNKAVLTKKILKVLGGLGLCANTTNTGMKMIIHRLAAELSNRLIGVVSRLECSGKTSRKCYIKTDHPIRYVEQVHVGANKINKENLKQDLIHEFEYSLRGRKICDDRDVLENIAETILDKIDYFYQGIDDVVRNEIKTVLENANMQGDAEIENVINIIMQNTREIVNMIASTNNTTNTIVTSGHCLIKPVSIIYTSEHDVTPSFAIPSGSSTPKKKKEVSKLSPEEKAYFDDISAVLREWVQNKPAHFKNLDDNNMNEVMILDLAGELVDQAKLGQLVKTADKETIITHYILKWVMKFEIVDRDDLKQAAPYATVLLKKLLALPVPVLKKPHHGTRQTIKNLKHQENTDFVPEAQDILEDEISIWMNEYPSHIYANPDKSVQNKLVHEFAEKLKHKNKSDKDYGKEINGWLKTVLKPGEKDRIDSMSTSLIERITKLPTDETIAANEEIKAQYQKQKQMHKDSPDISQNMTVENDNDNTLKEFIVKYVEHSSDEDDPLAKAAYMKLLTSELKRLSPTILEELREGQPLEKFAPQRLFKELQYIKDISDWLKTLPIDPKYNQVGNRNRIEFIINLAKDINQIEEERLQNPDAMNFDEMIMSTICMNMQTIPHRFQHGTRINEYVHPLIVQIFLKREENMPLIPDNQLWGNIADFLDDYIRLNGNDIVDDEAKVEVWAARLLEEIKKMIAENPYSLPRADLNDRLAGVAKPGDETVKRFEHELDYAKEISDWLHNFPLIDSVDDEMIRDLAEKMAESEKDNDENNLVKYIEQWILKLPLDISKQIDVPFVTQQLLNRKNKIVEDKDAKMFTLSQPKIINTSSKVVREQKESAKALCRGCCPVDDPGTIIVQVINEWCDKLPLVGANDVIKNTKTNIANKLYQKDMEINDNPRLARNDILYMESLLEIIDELLENLPPKVNIEGNTQELKTKLFDDLRQAKIFIKEVSLGDEYIRDLEDAVDLAVPNTAGGKSGAFEVYKENIVEKFILDNFDHGTDAISQKYKSKLQNEIDKYAYSVQQRLGTAIPIERLNNEIMSVLFDVKMPFENALQDNVEEIKTKCEVDDWVQKLPLRPVTGPADALNIDQKMRLLARKVHILEFKENPEEIILKEIRKWLTKAPLKRDQEPNIYKYADDLQEMLNKSRKNRKCVPSSVVAEAVLEPIDEDNSIWINPNITTDQKNSQDPPKHKTGDILLGLVEQWSNNIPFPSNVVSQNEIDAIKDDITVQIIKKISELNSSPSTFDDDRLYNHLMNEEIEKALARVPQNDTLIQSKGALKYQLTSAIESVKPLIREERARHEYKTELDATVKKILGAPENPTAAEKNMLEKVNEEIVDDFLEYQYNKNDNDGKEFYKNKMVKSLTQYNIIGEKDENKNEIISDTLVETNRLLCELQKVNAPMNLSLKDEVEEIRMKHEVNNFLDKVSPAPTNAASARRTSIRDSLAKQLHELEKTGHTDDNNKKMAAAVSRTLKRLNVEDKMDQIEPFIERLHKNEPIRKAPPYSPLALKELRMRSPPRDQTIEDHGGHLRVEASVYQPDYVPPNWVPPKPPLSSSLEQIFFIPHESLPPRSEPTGSTQQRLSQPTQTPAIDSTGTVPDQPRQRPTRARAKHAGVQSGPGLASREDGHTSDEDCLCALCKKYPCEFPFDYYDDCDCSLPMFRRPMMYPRCPPMMMPPCMPSPYMF